MMRSGLSKEEVQNTIESLAAEGMLIKLGVKTPHSLLFSAKGWERLINKLKQVTESYHKQFPLRRGMPKEELRSKLKIPAPAFSSALEQFIKDGILVEDEKVLRLASYNIQPTKEQQVSADAFLKSLTKDPYSPPGNIEVEPELLNYLIEQGKIVKVAENVVFAASAYEDMVERIKKHIISNGKITVAEVRDYFQTSRKYALALMEYLDEQKITRRVGDERVLR
jgi:selenocysteine-specific elongation factor